MQNGSVALWKKIGAADKYMNDTGCHTGFIIVTAFVALVHTNDLISTKANKVRFLFIKNVSRL